MPRNTWKKSKSKWNIIPWEKIKYKQLQKLHKRNRAILKTRDLRAVPKLTHFCQKNWTFHSCSWVFIFKFPLSVDIALNFCINLRHGLWSVTMSDKHNLTPGSDPDRFWFITTVFGTWWTSICQNQSSTSDSWVSKTLSYSSHSFTSFPLTFHAKKWVRPMCSCWQGRCPPSPILLALNI